METIDCEFCGQTVVRNAGNQRTCLSKQCQNALRSKTRKERYYRLRKQPICVWCGEAIKHKRKRRYHPNCRIEKNRERVLEYHERMRAIPEEERPKREKKQRKYKGKITCKICKKRVPRTGARQIICKSEECRRARKQETKKERRLLRKRIEELKQQPRKPIKRLASDPIRLDPFKVAV